MAPTNLSHRRTHNLLLISKLLNLREHASPFTLLLDSLEQPARPLIGEYIRRANESKTHTIFISFETLKQLNGVEKFIPAWKYGENAPVEITKQVAKHVADTAATSATKRIHLTLSTIRLGYIIILDTTHPLCTLSLSSSSSPSPPFSLPTFLSSLLIPPAPSPSISISLLATHHLDIPSPSPSPSPSASSSSSAYLPTPLHTLTYLATTLLTLHRPSHVLAARAAEERSLEPPAFGLAEGREGVVLGLHERRSRERGGRGGWEGEGAGKGGGDGGVVVEMEHRRRSGRGVGEWFFVRTSALKRRKSKGMGKGEGEGAGVGGREVVLLDDHPAFKKRNPAEVEEDGGEKELEELTFDLGLTDRQRREREGVVLPYFDAQLKGGGDGEGGGGGGRILYDMGVEDDFDEEEDEI
ncbi:MAG: hypothetical protein Q9160_009108 [Pyrenula sp. 1 TL-2023]